MASNRIVIEVDEYLKATRLLICTCQPCKYNFKMECRLKKIKIDDFGKCEQREPFKQQA